MTRRVMLTLLAVPILGLLAPRTEAAAPKPYKIGDKVANFALKNEAGKTINLAQYKGKVILINFYGFN